MTEKYLKQNPRIKIKNETGIHKTKQWDKNNPAELKKTIFAIIGKSILRFSRVLGKRKLTVLEGATTLSILTLSKLTFRITI